jgi:prophage DNA circulation protein
MTKPTAEAAGLVGRIAAAVTKAAPSDSAEAADLRFQAGLLTAKAAVLIVGGGLATQILATFNAARIAGATSEGLASLRLKIEAEAPVSAIAQAIKIGMVRICLGQEARVVAATEYVSRDDVERTLSALNLAFEAAQDEAADAGQTGAYRALVSMQAAVTRDLSTRSRSLPRMVSFNVPPATPALVLANRLYGDADRTDEILAENKVVHPLFLPLSGRALSA